MCEDVLAFYKAKSANVHSKVRIVLMIHLQLTLVGYTSAGAQQKVYWFPANEMFRRFDWPPPTSLRLVSRSQVGGN